MFWQPVFISPDFVFSNKRKKKSKRLPTIKKTWLHFHFNSGHRKISMYLGCSCRVFLGHLYTGTLCWMLSHGQILMCPESKPRATCPIKCNMWSRQQSCKIFLLAHLCPFSISALPVLPGLCRIFDPARNILSKVLQHQYQHWSQDSYLNFPTNTSWEKKKLHVTLWRWQYKRL